MIQRSIDKLANTLNNSGEEYVLLIWADFDKGKVFEGAGWVTTVMKLGKPEDIDQD